MENLSMVLIFAVSSLIIYGVSINKLKNSELKQQLMVKDSINLVLKEDNAKFLKKINDFQLIFDSIVVKININEYISDSLAKKIQFDDITIDSLINEL